MATIKSLLGRRHDLIPGAAHTYSKGDDQFPAVAPQAILKGKGVTVWGTDGKRYLDWCMGLRSVSLGHCHPVVNRAVAKQMLQGTNFGRPHVTEYILADFLIKTLPHVEMVKFAKNGSTVTTAATKLARAYTGRKYIAVCASHPFFSYDDWFIWTTACDAGIPAEIKKLTLTFTYNDLASLKKLFVEHPGEIACVIMEVVTTQQPKAGFLKGVQDLCKKRGSVFIVDEMITGFRWGLKGAVQTYGLKPDLVTYGKGIANGYSLAVLGGKKKIMELGGIHHKKERVFLISTTHGAEATSLAAALTTIQFMKDRGVSRHIWKMGAKLKKGLERLVATHGLQKQVEVYGFEPNLNMAFKDAKGVASQLLRTFFLQEVIKRGILFQGYFALSYGHGPREIERTLKLFDRALEAFALAVKAGDADKKLVGEPCKPVFRKYN